MLCCRPKKDKYNLDEAECENESDKKKDKSKDSKKSKNKDKLDKTNIDETRGANKNTVSEEKCTVDNEEHKDSPKNETATIEIDANKGESLEGLKDRSDNKKGHDKDEIVPGNTENNKTIEETITKSNTEKVESAVSAYEEPNSDKVPDKSKEGTESCRDEKNLTKVEAELVKKESAETQQTPEADFQKRNEETNVDIKDANKPSLQEADQGLTDLTVKTAAQTEEEKLVATDSEPVMSAAEMQAAIGRLEAVAVRLESLAQSTGNTGGREGGGAPAPGALTPSVSAYDSLTGGEFAKYLELSSKIGGDVQTQAEMVKTGFQMVKDFLVIATKSKKPSQTELVDLLKPISNQITATQDFREKKRGSKFFNHLSGISESIPALGWVSVEPTPGPYVKEMVDAGMFFTNRVVKEFKETEPMHVEWTKAWLGTLRELQAYIKDHHTTGVTWNPQGEDAKSASTSETQPPPPPAAGGPPPPPPPGPPPPPPPVMDMGEPSGGEAPDARTALFADLNKGEAVTSGLKKVTDDMKTHKNPALRATSQVPGVRAGPAPFKAPSGPKTAPKPNKVTAAAAKPPVLELQQKKWVVEYQIGNKTMVIDETNLKQTVYMYKCENSTLQIKGKVNSITLDNCKKVAVVFDDVVSSIEFVNCQSIQAQVIGKCPTVSIDKTDGCLMYLSKDSLEAEIVTAKSSEMNILVPKADGDFEEFPLPEQYKTTWNGKKFVTGVAECS